MTYDTSKNFPRNIGEENPKAKMTNVKVREARALARTGKYTHKQIADKFGISRTAMSSVIRGQSWSHVK